MAEPPRNSPPLTWSRIELAISIVSALLGGAAMYYLIGLLHGVDALNSGAVDWAQYIVGGLTAGGGVVSHIMESRARARAGRAIKDVDKALERFKDEHPDGASVSAEAIVKATLRDTGLKEGQLDKLVEQRRQRMLIDDEYFRGELSHLIVDYLQPLPRNAKRVVNKFRVELLIADERGLLKQDSRAMAQRIGKWLVLTERWPQLGRALSAAPTKIVDLERNASFAVIPAPAAPAVPAAAGAGASVTPAPPADPFTETVKVLAPFYAGDEDLRRFMQSRPRLSEVLPLLVNFVVEKKAS